MKANVFRNTGYSPSPITSVAANGSTICAFRRRKSLDLIDSLTLRRFLTINIPGVVVSSKFRDLSTVIALTEDNRVLIIDITTLEIESIDLSAVAIDLLYSDTAFAQCIFVYATKNNEIFIRRGNTSTLLYREKSPITALLFEHPDTVVFSTACGWVRILHQGQRLVSEIELKETVLSMVSVANGQYACTTSQGTAFLIDSSSGVVLHSISVRKSPLNAVVFADGLVHMSGADSRIICFAVSGGLSKCCQADLHTSEVLSMAVDSGRVITTGEDSMLVLNFVVGGRYESLRVFDELIDFGHTENYYWVCCGSSVDFFKPDSVIKVRKSDGGIRDAVNEKITFKISEDILENINIPTMGFRYFLRFSTQTMPTAVAVSTDQRYLAYSSETETVLYRLSFEDENHSEPGARVHSELLRSFGPAAQLLFDANCLVVLEIHTKNMLLYSLADSEVKLVLSYEDYREKVFLGFQGRLMVLLHSKQCIELPSDIPGSEEVLEAEELPYMLKGLPIEGTVVEAKMSYDEGKKHAIMLVRDDSGYSFVQYGNDGSISQADVCFGAGKANRHCGVLRMASDKYYVDASSLYICDSGRVRRYELGNVVHGVIPFGDDLIVLQNSWEDVQTRFKPSIFKEKYSNR